MKSKKNINKKINLPFTIWIVLVSACFIFYRLDILEYFGWTHLLEKDANPIPFRFLWIGVAMFIPISVMFIFNYFGKKK